MTPGPDAPAIQILKGGHTAPKEATEGSLQDEAGAFVGENPHLPGVRPAAWIDNPMMESENPDRAVSFREALIEGMPEHEPTADRRSWIILEAGFYDRTSQAMMNHNKLAREVSQNH